MNDYMENWILFLNIMIVVKFEQMTSCILSKPPPLAGPSGLENWMY